MTSLRAPSRAFSLAGATAGLVLAPLVFAQTTPLAKSFGHGPGDHESLNRLAHTLLESFLMHFLFATKLIAGCALLAGAAPAFSHIVLENRSAPAGSSYKAVFLVGHGCQGSATTGVAVQIPAGFLGAKPYPKAGWTVSAQLGKLAKPHDNHGKRVTEDVTVVSWKAATPEAALPDTFFDEFVLRGKLPASPGPLWFKVLQTCENGSNDWSEIPASGSSTQGLKSPAALLEVKPAETAHHHH